MNDMVTIAVGTNDEINVMKAVLESQGIPVFLNGELTNSIAPHQAAPGGIGAVQLLVPKEQEQHARNLLAKDA